MKAKNNKKEKSAIQEHLEEQFQQMKTEEEAPENLKKEVFNTLDTLQLFGDIADLFTAKFTQAEVQLVDIVRDEETPENEENIED